MNAKPIFFNPKNTGDQMRLSKSWVANKTYPQVLFCKDFSLANINNDNAIREYKVAQTGLNNQAGGCNSGCIKSLYQE